MSLIDRYVLKNFLESFFIGFLIFNFIIVLVSQLYNVIKWLVDGVYSFWEVLKYLFFISPMYLNYVIPISVVFGVVGAISRLSSNFEIIAFNTFGIDNMFIFRRVIGTVLFISFLHFLFNELVAYRFISFGLDMYYSASKEIKGTVNDFSYVWEDGSQINYIWAKQYYSDLELMRDIFIVVKSKVNMYISKAIVSDWAKKKENNVWHLYNVVIYDYLNKSRISINVLNYVFDFSSSSKRKKHREEMNIFDIYFLAKEYERNNFKDLALDMYVKLNLKFIFPFSSIFLIFLVFPFSLTRVRVSSFLGIILSISIAILYYIFLTLFQLISIRSGFIIFLWFPNFISIFLGGFLVFLKNKNYM